MGLDNRIKVKNFQNCKKIPCTLLKCVSFFFCFWWFCPVSVIYINFSKTRQKYANNSHFYMFFSWEIDVRKPCVRIMKRLRNWYFHVTLFQPNFWCNFSFIKSETGWQRWSRRLSSKSERIVFDTRIRWRYWGNI